MKIMRLLLLGVAALLLSVTGAKADGIIGGSGTWGADIITTPESAPGATWSFSFLVSDPATDAVDSGGGWQTAQVSDFKYLLNGAPVSVTLLSAIFFGAPDGGLFDLNLSDGMILSFFGDKQVFAEDPPPATANPGDPGPPLTFVDGPYDAESALNDNPTLGTGSGTIEVSHTHTTPVPEPATLSLLGFALAGLAFTRIRKD